MQLNCLIHISVIESLFIKYSRGDLPPKAYESNFVHLDLVQFGKQHIKQIPQVLGYVRIVSLFAI